MWLSEGSEECGYNIFLSLSLSLSLTLSLSLSASLSLDKDIVGEPSVG